jgi:hypothetical protein
MSRADELLHEYPKTLEAKRVVGGCGHLEKRFTPPYMSAIMVLSMSVVRAWSMVMVTVSKQLSEYAPLCG